MKVRLLRSWGGFDAGKVFESVPDGQAQAMIEYGYAEEVVAEDDSRNKPAIQQPKHRTKSVS